MSMALLAVSAAVFIGAAFAFLKPTQAETMITRTMQIRTISSILIGVFFVLYALQTGVWWLILIAAVAIALAVAWLLVDRPWRGEL